MRKTRLYSGLVLLAASIVSACLFFVPDYDVFYWSSPSVFVTFTVVGIVAAFFGSYFVRSSIFPGLRREKPIFELVVIFGDIIVLLGLMATAGAIYSVIAVAVHPMYWGKYYEIGESYNLMVLASQILFFWLSVVLLITGQFIIGLGHKRQKPA